MDTLVNAGAVIIQDDNILLVQEAQEPFRGKWNFPLGKIEPGETATTAAVREVQEETGYLVELIHFLGIYQNNPTEDLNIYIVMFVGKAMSGELEKQNNEILDVKWVSTEEIQKMNNSKLFHPEMKNATVKAFNNPLPLNTYINF